jgi:hypothetical protein
MKKEEKKREEGGRGRKGGGGRGRVREEKKGRRVGMCTHILKRVLVQKQM